MAHFSALGRGVPREGLNLSRRSRVPHLDEVHKVIARRFDFDAVVLDDYIYAALENMGRIPAGVRKGYKGPVPEGLVEAIEAEVKGKLSRQRQDRERHRENQPKRADSSMARQSWPPSSEE